MEVVINIVPIVEFVVMVVVVEFVVIVLVDIILYVVENDTEDRDSIASLLLPMLKVLKKMHSSYNDAIG